MRTVAAVRPCGVPGTGRA